ncbi:MAG: lanthionine synthetase C family protein [Gaiellaceae bacterium]
MPFVLYRPEAFEPLTERPWDDALVRGGIRRIVADVDAAYDADALWPADEWDGWQAATPMKNLYVGASGVIHALDVLRRRGIADSRLDLPSAAARALGAFREAPDFMRGENAPAPAASALLRGETGILLVASRLSPSPELERDLLQRVRQNVDNAADEVMWGTPGTLIAARAMLEWTGGDEWRHACRDSADSIWRRRGDDGLWVQRLHGTAERRLNPAHGLVGNVLALRDAIADDRRAQLLEETSALLDRTAVVEGGLANWPLWLGAPLELSDGEIRVQWCGGAPGMVAGAAEYLDEELLLAGARLVWEAGPPGLDKGSSICHGTAGNGYAFLKAFERTGDEEWLERARRFAMHALDQVERRGRSRYSLWTGDLGVALYAADCLAGRTAYPVFETWE